MAIAHPRTDEAGSTADILLVDDDEVFRESVAALLRAAGHRVRMAPDYREALPILDGRDPLDLLILDIVMPDRVNGLALGRMAKLRRPNVRIAYITGYSIPDISNEALGPVFQKPLDEDAFLRSIAALLAE